MHALEVIVQRNIEAAAREAAHADNDGNEKLGDAIVAQRPTGAQSEVFWDAYWHASEGWVNR